MFDFSELYLCRRWPEYHLQDQSTILVVSLLAEYLRWHTVLSLEETLVRHLNLNAFRSSSTEVKNNQPDTLLHVIRKGTLIVVLMQPTLNHLVNFIEFAELPQNVIVFLFHFLHHVNGHVMLRSCRDTIVMLHYSQ